MAANDDDGTAVTELQELLEENPELLKELDAELIRLCEKLGVI